MTEPSADPIKALWRDQLEEEPTMTAKAIRALARNHSDNVRERQLTGYILIAFQAAFFGWAALRAPNALTRAGELLILLGLAWMVWRYRLRRPGRLPDTDASAQTLLAFHRAELDRQKNGYIWMLTAAAPAIVGMVVMMAGMKMARHGSPNGSLAPFFLLLGVWFVAGWFIHHRQSQRIQRQIEDLDALTGN